MTIEEIIKLAGDNWGWCIIAFLSLVEVSKIKINPWSSLFRWIGRLFVEDVRNDIKSLNSKVDDLESNVSQMREENLENDAKVSRARILRCSDEVYLGERHSKEYFDTILSDITFYKMYCQHHPEFKNEMTVMATQRIEEVYQRCMKEHTFL